MVIPSQSFDYIERQVPVEGLRGAAAPFAMNFFRPISRESGDESSVQHSDGRTFFPKSNGILARTGISRIFSKLAEGGTWEEGDCGKLALSKSGWSEGIRLKLNHV